MKCSTHDGLINRPKHWTHIHASKLTYSRASVRFWLEKRSGSIPVSVKARRASWF